MAILRAFLGNAVVILTAGTVGVWLGSKLKTARKGSIPTNTNTETKTE